MVQRQKYSLVLSVVTYSVDCSNVSEVKFSDTSCCFCCTFYQLIIVTSFLRFVFYFMCEYFAYMSERRVHVVPSKVRRGSVMPLKLGSQVVVSHHVGTGN